jgi:hypothetical protein
MFRIDEIQPKSEDHGQKRQNPSGHASLSGMHANLPLQAEAFPDYIPNLVQHFSEVASALFLNQDGGDDHFQILQWDAGHQIVHGRLQFEAVVLFVEASAELGAKRVSDFSGDQIEGRVETVAGAHSAHHQIKRLGQLLLKFGESLSAFEDNKDKRGSAKKEAYQKRKRNRTGSQVNEICGDEETSKGHEQ